jgi:isocitrate lyase
MGGLAAGAAAPVAEAQGAPAQSSKRTSDDRAIAEISRAWASDERWKGIDRPYSAKDVVRLRGSVQINSALARMGAEKLWRLMHTEPYIQITAATFVGAGYFDDVAQTIAGAALSTGTVSGSTEESQF